MDWLISFENFEELATSRPSPPYVLLIAGLLIIAVCALPLVIAVRQRIEYWSKYSAPDTLPIGGKLQVIMPFSGTVGGVYIFLASGLEVLGLPVLPSLFFSLILTGLLTYLASVLFGRVLSQRALRNYLNQSSSDFPAKEHTVFNPK